jgi:iron complex outermembrane recepter protein
MRSAVLATGICLSLIGSCFAQISTAVMSRVETHIPPQTLEGALKQFEKLEHIRVLYLDAAVEHVRTSGASGYLTTDETLARLLSGTGLKYRYVDSNAVSIISPCCTGSTRTEASTPRAPAYRAQAHRIKQPLRQPQSGSSAVGGSRSDPKNSPPLTNQRSQRDGTTHGLAEIIVTAQKYRQPAFDVPMSLDVISGSQLLQHDITNLSNLQYDVPGLYMNSSGYSQAVYIRGVANDSGNGAVVGQYIDEADITAEGTTGQAGLATGDVGLYDLNRVEVLKGPQGTLYGDGSLGGVIRYITNRPVLDSFQMSADVADMLTEYGAPSQRIETMLNTPIASGAFALRFAGIFEHDGGWVDEPAAHAKNINGSNLADGRIEVLWQPTERVTVNVMQIVHRRASGLGMGEDTSGNITPIFQTTLTPNQTDASNLSNVTLTYDLDSVRILSSSSYLSDTQDIYNEMVSTPLGSETYWSLFPIYHSQNRASTEELRLVNSGQGPWQWTIGGFYKHFTDQIFYSDYSGFAGSTLSSAFFSPPSAFDNTSTAKAAFANTSYRLPNRITVGAGLRYYTDRESVVLPTGESIPPSTEAATFTSTDPRFYVQYRPTLDLNLYASASKGFRSGGFNEPSQPTYKPESLWSYDLGIKMRFPDRGLRLDVDLFYMNYSNYVNLTYIPPTYEYANIGKARIKGVDAGLMWRPGALWQFSLNSELLNTDFLTASAISGYVAGDRLPFAPRYSFTASAMRYFQWEDKPSDIELYYYEISRVQDRAFGSPLEQSDIQRLLNFRASIHWNDNLQFGLVAQNLLNDRGNESPWGIVSESIRPRPRTFGVDFSVRFN